MLIYLLGMRLFIFLLLSSAFVCSGAEIDDSTQLALEFNQNAADLLVMYDNGKIKESGKKEALFESGIDKYFTKTFKDLELGYRIDEIVPIWKLFEDDGYFIHVGSVYENADSCFLFVWVLRDNVRTTGGIETVFLEVGGQKIIGKKYPKGIIPRKSWWQSI